TPGYVLISQLRAAFGGDGAVYTAAALANAPGSAGGGSNLNLAQALAAPRSLDGVADGSLTVGDALWSALAGAAGKETVTGTAYKPLPPPPGPVLRTSPPNNPENPPPPP